MANLRLDKLHHRFHLHALAQLPFSSTVFLRNVGNVYCLVKTILYKEDKPFFSLSNWSFSQKNGLLKVAFFMPVKSFQNAPLSHRSKVPNRLGLNTVLFHHCEMIQCFNGYRTRVCCKVLEIFFHNLQDEFHYVLIFIRLFMHRFRGQCSGIG